MPSLSLIPTKSAVDRKLAGFHSGNPLKLNFTIGETAAVVLKRFNAYRGPDSQIQSVYTAADLKTQFPVQTPLNNDTNMYIV
jgi:hypothetical protein